MPKFHHQKTKQAHAKTNQQIRHNRHHNPQHTQLGFTNAYNHFRKRRKNWAIE